MSTQVSIESITIPESRHRRVFDNIDKLAESIKSIGLIHPIVIERQGDILTLVAGERRLKAYKLLELPTIPVDFRDELDEWTRCAIELEENLQREQLTYSEEVEAKLRLHELYQAKHGKPIRGSRYMETGGIGGHMIADTAELLDESVGKTTQDLQLAKAIRINPALGNYKTKSSAFKAMQTVEDIDLRRKIAAILSEDTSIVDIATNPNVIICGDSREVLKAYPDSSFDFCITDPPYGVEYQSNADAIREWGEDIFDDNWDLSLNEEVFQEVFRVLREGAHCYVFYASIRHQDTLELLRRVGFWVRPLPLVWIKAPGQNPSPYTRYTSAYEPIFFCAKGSPRRFVKYGLSDVFEFYNSSIRKHPNEKPVELIKTLLSVCSVEGELGLDPFFGCGNFGVACKQTQRRSVGIELEQRWFSVAFENQNMTEIESTERRTK